MAYEVLMIESLPWRRILHCWQHFQGPGLGGQAAGRPPCVEDRRTDDRSPTVFGPSFWPASGRPTSRHSSPGRIQAKRQKQTSRTPVKKIV